VPRVRSTTPAKRPNPLAKAPFRCERVPEKGLSRGSRLSNRTDDLRITRVFPCVARGFKARASFMSAGCCWWRSLAIDGYWGASRGHAPEVRRSSSRWARRRRTTFRFSGRTYPQLARIVRELCAVGGRCCQRLAAAVAVTVAVSGWFWSPFPRSPRRCDSTLACPGPSPEPDSCRT